MNNPNLSLPSMLSEKAKQQCWQHRLRLPSLLSEEAEQLLLNDLNNETYYLQPINSIVENIEKSDDMMSDVVIKIWFEIIDNLIGKKELLSIKKEMLKK